MVESQLGESPASKLYNIIYIDGLGSSAYSTLSGKYVFQYTQSFFGITTQDDFLAFSEIFFTLSTVRRLHPYIF